MAKKVLITTAIDYVNDVIHIGHAYQKILADVLARYHRQVGHDTFFLTGTDEHGSKTEETAEKKKVSPQNIANAISAQDKKQLDILNISYDRFIRTTDQDHYQVVEDFYQRSYQSGDIYLGKYQGIYCVGCESFLKEKDLTDNRCPAHPNQKPTRVAEENYFFRWSKYKAFLREYIESHPNFVQPKARRNEMLAFLDQGLEDIPITRPTVKFGIPVLNDPKHVLYVWFDALINYITGKPEYWQDKNSTIIHIIGKDNLRWHALLWPAMLKSAKFRLPNVVYAHDFLTLNGQKISKSLGNIIRPVEMVDQFGVDATRYFFLRYGPLRNDVNVTFKRIKEVYNADLANGLGNLVSRVAKLCERSELEFESVSACLPDPKSFYGKQLSAFRLDDALTMVWSKLTAADKFVDHNQVWKQKGLEQEKSLKHLVNEIYGSAALLLPFMPETAQKIQNQFQGPKIFSQKDPLFPRML